MMRNKLILSALVGLACMSCTTKTQNEDWVAHSEEVACQQLESTAKQLDGQGVFPRSIWVPYKLEFLESQLGRDRKTFQDSLRVPVDSLMGSLRTCDIYDWTSGFFPGSLWYAYELTGNEEMKKQAIQYTNLLYPIRLYDKTHDIGFMMNCSYGNALRLSPNDSIPAVLTSSADMLCKRFDKRIGCIRSWDFGTWNFPVIIDNMMNLDLLFNAYHLTGDKKYYDVAVTHALTTMKHHFRKRLYLLSCSKLQ